VGVGIGLFLCALMVTLFIGRSKKSLLITELIGLQKQIGLSIAYFYRSLDVVSFADRELIPGREILPPGESAGGDISPDGTEIAFLHFNSTIQDLGIMRSDGSDLREYPEVVPEAVCWSYDQSKLAVEVQNTNRGKTAPNDPLLILNLDSGTTQQVDVRAYVTSQYWSPNSKALVYGTEDSVRLYDAERNIWSTLAKGTQPTWSPDGNWVSFRDGGSYYAMRPSGEDRRLLFRTRGAISGLWWSPDSHFVAYVSRNRLFERPFIAIDVGWVRLRVRRLADASEDWVAQLSDVDLPRFHWIKTKIQ
jgi:hypothetical protein